MRKQKVPDDYHMVSFDVTSIFTNVPLVETIEIILRKVDIDKEINTNIPKKEMKELPHLCTKNVHFIFNGEVYILINGVAMGFPLGPVLKKLTPIFPKKEMKELPHLCTKNVHFIFNG